jgi:hypothetical protein
VKIYNGNEGLVRIQYKCLIWNLYFAVLLERTLGSTAGVKRRAGNCCQTVVGGSSLPSPLLLQLSREFK